MTPTRDCDLRVDEYTAAGPARAICPPTIPTVEKPRLWLGVRGGAEGLVLQRHSRKVWSSAPKQFGARRLVPTRKGKPRRSGARTSWKEIKMKRTNKTRGCFEACRPVAANRESAPYLISGRGNWFRVRNVTPIEFQKSPWLCRKCVSVTVRIVTGDSP
jgi:hypothetical protein